MSEQVTHFPPPPVTANPVRLYQEIVFPQIASGRKRLYTPGPVTSGWAFNITRDMEQVISRNSEFANLFVSQVLLNREKPIVAQVAGVNLNLENFHITVPHAIGKCIHPIEQEGGSRNWGEFDYYIVWLMTMMGLEPGLAGAFAANLSRDVKISVVNDRHGIRSVRVAEVQIVFQNAVAFMRSHRQSTDPVSAVIALPEPAHSHHEVSVGTELEAQFANALELPLGQFVINTPRVTETKTDPDELWDGLVATWLIEQMAQSPMPPSHSDQLVDVAAYRQLQPW